MRRFRFVYRGSNGPEELEIELEGSRCVLTRGRTSSGAAFARLPDGRLSLLLDDGRQISGRVRRVTEAELEVVAGSDPKRIPIADPLRDRIAHARQSEAGTTEDEEVRALMPGRVVEVSVEPGQHVAPGDLVLVLEAMKMQNEIRSSRAGTVIRICVEAGRPVEGGSLLAVIRSG